MRKNLLIIAVGFLVITASVNAGSQYKGQQMRDIKALSQSDIDGYLKGKGMGLAKAAELNHYPGPRHVLDLAKELELTEKQQMQTQDLFDSMQSEAIVFGKQIVEKEQALDKVFTKTEVNPDELHKILLDIGSLQAKLRYVHLSAHLKQKQILTKHQVMLYDKARGYGEGHHNMGNHSH
jgi:Spy/CpxP family protein refolding chaperone